MDKLPAPQTRHSYATQAVEHNWSRKVLNLQIETWLLERSGKVATNFGPTLPRPESELAREPWKDPADSTFLA